MNRQRIAKNWNRPNRKAGAKWRKAADGDLLVLRRDRARARPDHADEKASPLPQSMGATPLGNRREPAPVRLDEEGRRRALLALRAHLQGDLVRTAETTLSNGIEATVAAPDTVDCASDVVEQDLAIGLLGSATATLEQIDTSLQRIAEGTYGRCLHCGARIPAARLEAVPYATCCVACATRQERVA